MIVAKEFAYNIKGTLDFPMLSVAKYNLIGSPNSLLS